MASSLISNTNHVYFASVLAMDNACMVAMFEALVASGLNGFLGCLSDIYEAALVEFFQNTSVRDGQVISTVQGKLVEISEEVFARTFQFPVEGLMDLNEVPKDLVFDARSVFSFNGEQLSTSCKKREMKFDFRLLCDILAKSVTVKVGSFDAVTHERFFMMTAIYGGIKVNWGRLLFNIFKDMVTPGSRQARGYAVQICILLKNVQNLELGDSKEFPPLKILTAKTVGRYIAINEKIGVEEVEDVSRVKKTPAKKVASRKRPVAAGDAPTIAKNKRTTSGKAAPKDKDLAVVSVALDAIPIQTVDPSSSIPAAHPSAPKFWAPKRQFRIPTTYDDDIVEKRAAVEGIIGDTAVGGTVEKEPVITETAQMDTDVEEPVGSRADTIPEIGEKAVDGTFVKEQIVQRSDETENSESEDEFGLSASKQPSQISESENRAVESASAAYLVEEPMEETEQNQGTEIADAVLTADAKISDDESMTIEEHLSMIPDGSSLPSTTLKVTKIQFGTSITIRGVNEGDCFNRLAALNIDDIYAKEEKVLTWAETDSTRIALQRKMYILTKYRELLLRKFLEARKTNFVPGQSTSAIDLKVLDMLSYLHVDELKTEMQEHGLIWEMTCCSRLFEGPNRDRGAVISGSNKNIRSSCWIRTMIHVDGSWVIEPCADYWKPLPRRIIQNEILPQIAYVDTLPPVSDLFKLFKKRWADVCIEAAELFIFGKLLPVDSLNFCRALTVVEPAQHFAYRRPIVTTWGWSQLCKAFLRFSLIGGLQTVHFRILRSDFVSVRPVLGAASIFYTVLQLAPVPSLSDTAFDSDVQMDAIQSLDPDSDSSSSHDLMDIHVDTPVLFTTADALQGTDTISIKQVRTQRSLDDLKSELLFKINNLVKASAEARDQQTQYIQNSLKSVRQEARTQGDVLSVKLNEFQKGSRAHRALVTTELEYIRKDVKAMDEQLATIRSEMLDFRAQAQENHLNLSTQLGFLVDYINRGGDAKKGEGGSKRPQPPPDYQSRPSGGSGSRGSGGDGSSQRRDRGGFSKKRHNGVFHHSSGGGGPVGPIRRDAEYWICGKRQF
ncbi:hypothetical protein F511_38188 [Dorcoceras hygrometricum]|uniref:Dystroglycan-like n=1 Tax=Dorcoceras hygrometricum TaxID=472368 RepID=A0A2Z7BDG9_9LAMI|nr:hypothetical protein F511_38188 [Dorcoceras hygrometricum]